MLHTEEKSYRFVKLSEFLDIVIASKIYRCRLLGIVIASYSYCSKVTKSLLFHIA
jgi:hypothetical protein